MPAGSHTDRHHDRSANKGSECAWAHARRSLLRIDARVPRCRVGWHATPLPRFARPAQFTCGVVTEGRTSSISGTFGAVKFTDLSKCINRMYVRARHLYEYSTAAGPLPEPHATGSMKATRMVAIVTKEIWAQRRSHGQARTSARCHERAAARASSPSPGNSCGSEPSAYCTPIHPRRARGAPAQYGDDSKHREGTPDLALV